MGLLRIHPTGLRASLKRFRRAHTHITHNTNNTNTNNTTTTTPPPTAKQPRQGRSQKLLCMLKLQNFNLDSSATQRLRRSFVGHAASEESLRFSFSLNPAPPQSGGAALLNVDQPRGPVASKNHRLQKPRRQKIFPTTPTPQKCLGIAARSPPPEPPTSSPPRIDFSKKICMFFQNPMAAPRHAPSCRHRQTHRKCSSRQQTHPTSIRRRRIATANPLAARRRRPPRLTVYRHLWVHP